MTIDTSVLAARKGKGRKKPEEESGRVYVTLMAVEDPTPEDLKAAALWRAIRDAIGGAEGVRQAMITAYRVQIGELEIVEKQK